MPRGARTKLTRSWEKAAESSPERERIEAALRLLQDTAAGPLLVSATDAETALWARIFSGSLALTELLAKHPAWLADLRPELIRHPRREQGLQSELETLLSPAVQSSNVGAAFEGIRLFKQKEMLRIGARDLGRLGPLSEILRELSAVADVCLRMAEKICAGQLEHRLGTPWAPGEEEGWSRCGFCVLAMGKLGGHELNYSSDIDLLFVYRDEGTVSKTAPGKTAPRGLSNHKFFQKLAENLIGELGRVTEHGFLFRVDMRLRPEGPAGPLVRSLASYENYYAQWGQSWERMMLIKARPVAGDAALGWDFLEVIQPFRYPRFLSEGLLQEVAGTKKRIEEEVLKPDELDRHVKLGRGGIREIEFFVQALQLLHGGRLPFLQSPQTLPTLDKLVDYKLISESDAARLKSAYIFLRELEHRLQIEQNLQTHTVPQDRRARQRLAFLLDLTSVEAFEATLSNHQAAVRQIYDQLFAQAPPAEHLSLPPFESADAWHRLLAGHSFKEIPKSFRLIQSFCLGPGYGHVSARTIDLAKRLVARLMTLCLKEGQSAPPDKPFLSDPDRVLARLDSFIQAYGSRALLYESWVNYPTLFELWLLLFDRSEYLAEIAIRTPDLVDDLLLTGQLRRRKEAPQILEELREGLGDADQSLWLRRYHQVELMRIGLRDILGLAGLEQNLFELSGLADACLEYSLEVILRKRGYKKTPCAIIGLGKLGGQELNYGSDLDILFITDGPDQALPRLQQVAAEVMDLLSRQTAAGQTFVTDARLRPDGEKGLLVNTLAAYEEYYRKRSQLWEIQALTRARAVAGNPDLGRRFLELCDRLTNFRAASERPAAFQSNWKSQIAAMRRRIEKERTAPGKDALAFKTGAGGLVDAEFIAQSISLAEGWREPNTLKALERARSSQAIPAELATQLTAHYQEVRRVEAILRRWSFQAESTLPDDEAALRRVALRCGYASTLTFVDHLAVCRARIREVYRWYFKE